jgi:hypothetical protein
MVVGQLAYPSPTLLFPSVFEGMSPASRSSSVSRANQSIHASLHKSTVDIVASFSVGEGC